MSGHCNGCHSQTRAHLLTSTHCGHVNCRSRQMTLLFPTRGHPTEEAGRGPTRELEAVTTAQLPLTRKGGHQAHLVLASPMAQLPPGLRRSSEAHKVPLRTMLAFSVGTILLK